MKVQLRKDKNLHPKKYKKGQIVTIPDKVAQRWIARDIAVEIKGKESK